MRGRVSKPLIFVVISAFIIVLIYGPSFSFNVHVQGKPIAGTHINCDYASSNDAFFEILTCCWWEERRGYVCQVCSEDGSSCGPIKDTDPRDSPIREQPPPPPGPKGPLGSIPEGGGVLPELDQTPPSPPQPGEIAPEVAQPTAPEAAQLPTLEEAPAPTCPEGQVSDEETNLCVLEEPEADEELEQAQPEEEPESGSEDQESEDQEQESNSDE